MKKKGKRLLMLLCGLCCGFMAWGQETAPSLRVDSTATYVHFRTGRSELLLDYNGNRETLEKFVENVNRVMNSESYSIMEVRIVGYASPEGPLQLNERLSRERAEVLKDYLRSRTGLPDHKFEVVSGGENWDDLEVMVKASEMGNKEEVLAILTSELPKTAKESRLKGLPGSTYQYMLQNFYPRLRSASSLQLVERHPVPDTLVVVAEEPQPESRAADTVYRQPQKPVALPPAPCRCAPPFLGVSTNLAYWAAVIIPNIQLETYFARRYSFTAEGIYRWPKDRRAKGNNANLAYVSPEFRLFARDDASYAGHYFGLYGQYGEYDIKLGHTGRQGYFKGGGLSYGYIFKFNRFDCLYFDLGLSVGYGRMKYDSYYWYDPCNAYEGHANRNYWGPTKMKASLTWRF